MDQTRLWIAEAPPWLPLALAVAATAAVIQLHRLWRQSGWMPNNLRAALVAAVTLAIAGALPAVLPELALQLGESAWQLQAIGYLASAFALIMSVVQTQKLRRDGGHGGGAGGHVGETVRVEPIDDGSYGGAGNATPPWPIPEPGIGGIPHSPPPNTVLQRKSPRRSQMAWLAAMNGPHAGNNWQLGEETYLGQGLTDPCDIVLADATVSRGHHALIRLQDDGSYLLADLASTNHTFVNGERVLRHTLQDKDRIGIGTSELLFVRASLQPATGKNDPGVSR